jgi:AraC-like DNA-binding protein
VGSAGTLSSLELLKVVETLERMGFVPAPMLAAAGISRRRLYNPLARLEVELEHALWAEVESATSDPAIGLKVGVEAWRTGRRTVDAYIAIYSPTAREMFANVERFVRLADDRGHVQVEEHDEVATVRVYRDGGYPRALGYIDSLFAGTVRAMRERLEDFVLLAVQLPRPEPNDPAPYLDAFGVMPSFATGCADLSFPRRLLDVPVRGADSRLAEMLKEHARELLRNVPSVDPLLTDLQQALFQAFGSGEVGLAPIARRIGTSSRTLRRRLADLGTSFQAELDAMRRDLALQQLRAERTPISDIAERLGFASANAFQRAFRRWTGQAPSTYRSRAQLERS